MLESKNKIFNHFKIHTQYSICEGAVKIDELKDFCKKNKITCVGLSDTSNLCGALEFSEHISKVGTQPIIGTQIIFKYKDDMGLLSLIAKNENGYKRIIELSSKSFLDNDNLNDPHCNFEDLLNKNEGFIILSGGINGLLGKLFNKAKNEEIEEIYKKLSQNYNDNFYIEIQRHGDQNEKSFEIFNLNQSKKLNIPIIASHEVYYIDQSMFEAHDALMCIGSKTYLNVKNRVKLSDQHYFKSGEEMKKTFSDLPEALENNYNLPFRCSFRPLPSKPILPNISSEKGTNAEQLLVKESQEGLVQKFVNIFGKQKNELHNDN